MRGRKTSNTQQQQDQFTCNCRYLGLKLLAEEYRQMVDMANENTVGYYEFISNIVQAEAAVRQQRHIENLIKNSRLPYPLKLLADFDFDFQPKLNRKLINDLNAGVYEKTLDKRMRKYINPELLIIDEMGHDRLELQMIKEAHLLFKVIDQRYKDNKSLIFTTNIEEQDWPEFLGDPISTSAILDRIFHHSVIVRIKGPSYRKRQGELLQEEYAEKKKGNVETGE